MQVVAKARRRFEYTFYRKPELGTREPYEQQMGVLPAPSLPVERTIVHSTNIYLPLAIKLQLQPTSSSQPNK